MSGVNPNNVRKPVTAASITDATAAGRDMLTAADADAQLTLLSALSSTEIAAAYQPLGDYATGAEGDLATSALQPEDIASGTITPRDDDIDLSGGSIGDVITVQADGSLALSTPAGGAESPLTLTASNATETPLTIQGAASQSTNLTEWETSVGAVISSVSIGTGSPGGSITGGRFQAARSDLTSQTTQYDWSGIVCSGAGNILRIVSPLGIILTGAVSTTGGLTVGGNISGNSSITFGLDRAGIVGGGFFIAGTTRKVGIWNNNPSAQIDVHCNSPTTIGCIIQAAAIQTENLHEWRNSDGTVLSAVRADGSTKPAALADADAVNDSFYYSTDAGKLVYKDASGTVNNLY